MITGTKDIGGIGEFGERFLDLRNMRRSDIGKFSTKHKLDFDMSKGKRVLVDELNQLYIDGGLKKNQIDELKAWSEE